MTALRHPVPLTITDALGRAVLTRMVATPATGLAYELNLAGLAPGVYVLQLHAGATQAVRRLVIE